MEALLDKKIVLEERVLNLEDDLRAMNGDKGRLIDKDGFPRTDIDVASVARMRNELLLLKSEHEKVMKEIEEKLPEALKLGHPLPSRPFAIITRVDTNGLAYRMGLQVADKVVCLNGICMYDRLRECRFDGVTTVKILRNATLLTLKGEGDRLGAQLQPL